MLRSVLFLGLVALAVSVDWEAPPQNAYSSVVFEDDERQLNSLVSLALESIVKRGEWETIVQYWFPQIVPVPEEQAPCRRTLPTHPKGLLANILRTQKVRWCVDVNDFGENPYADGSFTAIYNHTLVTENDGHFQPFLGVSDGDLFGPFVTMAEIITVEMGLLMNAPLAPVIVFVPDSETDSLEGPFEAVSSAMNHGLCDVSLPTFRRFPSREQTVDFTCPVEPPTDIYMFGNDPEFGDDDVDRFLEFEGLDGEEGDPIVICDVDGTQSEFAARLWFPKATFETELKFKNADLNKVIETQAEAFMGLCNPNLINDCDYVIGGGFSVVPADLICAQRFDNNNIRQVTVTGREDVRPISPGQDLAAFTARPKSRRTIVDYTHASPLPKEEPAHPHRPMTPPPVAPHHPHGGFHGV